VIGIDILSGCKGQFFLPLLHGFAPIPLTPLAKKQTPRSSSRPSSSTSRASAGTQAARPAGKPEQISHTTTHAQTLTTQKKRRFFLFVERNLGFEAEHHKRALEHIPGVSFYVDHKASRVGVLTTEATKHAMAQLVVSMLAEKRVHVLPRLYSADPDAARIRLREQMETYSAQYKQAPDTFGKDKISLSGKVGGMKDDVCICLQLAAYFTQLETQRAADMFSKLD
jgi:hypothetical protein